MSGPKTTPDFVSSRACLGLPSGLSAVPSSKEAPNTFACKAIRQVPYTTRRRGFCHGTEFETEDFLDGRARQARGVRPIV